MTKAQGDLPGYERPTHEELDVLTARYLDKSKQHGKSTAALVSARAELDAKMVEVGELDAENDEVDDVLQLTPDGDPVYVYRDGELEFAVVMNRTAKLKVEKLTPKNDPAAVLG